MIYLFISIGMVSITWHFIQCKHLWEIEHFNGIINPIRNLKV